MECVDEFYYLREMICEGDGMQACSIARKRFNELLFLLTLREFSLSTSKYGASVISVLLYGKVVRRRQLRRRM